MYVTVANIDYKSEAKQKSSKFILVDVLVIGLYLTCPCLLRYYANVQTTFAVIETVIG